jgi:hypothetical protein
MGKRSIDSVGMHDLTEIVKLGQALTELLGDADIAPNVYVGDAQLTVSNDGYQIGRLVWEDDQFWLESEYRET